MPVVREAYLTIKQMESIGIQDAAPVFDEDMKIRKRCAEDAAGQLCTAPYFPLYMENDMNSPAAYYFTAEKVIIPTGLNELKRRIYAGWSHLDSDKESDSDKAVAEYLPASDEQAVRLHDHLKRFIKSNGVVTELAFSFLFSADYLLFRKGSRWMYCKMPFRRPGNFKGTSLPVWSYSFAVGKKLLNGWAKLYQRYGLVPDVKEILVWLHDLPEYKPVKLTEEQYKDLKEYFRKADFLRLGSKYYLLSEEIFDDGRCWDVYENGQPDIDKIRCIFPDGEWISAIAPEENIVGGGLVSIDFGTKSTVVVISNLAAGIFYTLKSRKEHDEENPLYPTVLKFCSLEKFLEAYESKAGRPETSWETVSIDDSAHGGGSSDSALGIFRSLKQWMMDPDSGDAVLRQKDAPDIPVILNKYGSARNSIDPIELYAYYLGLYINNNKDKKIFLRYRLSFSATCPEQIKRKMGESFKRGLTKSLPASIINSNKMVNFSIDCTCSEPAAYAVCALACMGMPNDCQEHFYYGIFDFGGGTCDFNYGFWGSGKDEKPHKDKYKICILGDGGDPFLGGENLLELLAVQVCIENKEWFKEHGFKISRPRCYEGGNEEFFAASFEAANNLECLVDQLRNPVWEKPGNSNGGNKENEEFEIIVSGLIPERRDGSYPAALKLKLSREPLEKLLEKRIYAGVSAFFNTCYRTLEEQGEKEALPLCVFLAGNSCRSKWVRKVFEKYIDGELDKTHIKEVYLCDPLGSPEFKEHIPSGLWNEEQKERMCEKISRFGDLDGKTGVAYGLALYGNRVEIEDRSVKAYLSYYLGTRSFFDIKVLSGKHGDRLAIGENVPFAASAIGNLYYTKMIPKDGELIGVRAIELNEQNVLVKENMTCFVRVNSQTEISIFAVSGDAPEKHDPGDELIFDLQSGQFKKAAHNDE